MANQVSGRSSSRGSSGAGEGLTGTGGEWTAGLEQTGGSDFISLGLSFLTCQRMAMSFLARLGFQFKQGDYNEGWPGR